MNIKILLLVLANIVASTLSQQVLKIDNYQYPTSFRDSYLISKQRFDKKGNFGDSSSNSGVCGSDKLFGGNYVSLNNCILFNGHYTTFHADNDKVIKTTFSDNQCTQGNEINQTTSIAGECISDGSSYPIMYSIVDINEIDPWYYKSAVSISYGGDCKGNWQDTFIQSYHITIDQCINLNAGLSILATCNSTTISQAFSTSNTCSNSEIVTTAVGTVCENGDDQINLFNLCNLFG
ncbi:hypothetical protein ACTFIY_003057 [Dictyostelium cf. discoideum]